MAVKHLGRRGNKAHPAHGAKKNPSTLVHYGNEFLVRSFDFAMPTSILANRRILIVGTTLLLADSTSEKISLYLRHVSAGRRGEKSNAWPFLASHAVMQLLARSAFFRLKVLGAPKF
jgi:hypothetical protein